MSMFDTIKIRDERLDDDVPFQVSGREWQTKSFRCVGATYTVDEDGIFKGFEGEDVDVSLGSEFYEGDAYTVWMRVEDGEVQYVDCEIVDPEEIKERVEEEDRDE